jgi:polysaccharide export outer membrane protein
MAALSALLSGCGSFPAWFPSDGASREQVEAAAEPKTDSAQAPIPVIDVDAAVTQRIVAARQQQSFARTMGDKAPPAYLIGPGDVLQVIVWEAPPAALFGSLSSAPMGAAVANNSTAFPEQMVDAGGRIQVPFAGTIKVTGRSLEQTEAEIARRLAGKANHPQVMVRVVRNASSDVTVVGGVKQSMLLPLTSKGEHLLDAIAAAGGVVQPVGKTSIQLSRGGRVVSMPMDSVISDPRQNIWLQPGDVVTALFQPNSFTVLGATGKNGEVPFETQGISLTQALARAGGVNDLRGDARGVFLFRFENPQVLDLPAGQSVPMQDGKVPVIYRVDLKDPRSFLVAQRFPVDNGDVLYVSNAPGAELQKFLNILTSSVFTAASLVNLAH